MNIRDYKFFSTDETAELAFEPFDPLNPCHNPLTAEGLAAVTARSNQTGQSVAELTEYLLNRV